MSSEFLNEFSEFYEAPESNEADVVEFKLGHHMRESLHDNYINEIDIWARQALASNGFGDY
ncbi:MAG: hypothetical protein AAF353_16880 [Pseudomonadota bacterium]